MTSSRKTYFPRFGAIQRGFDKMNEVKVVRPTEVETCTVPGGSRVKRFLTQEKDGSGFILGLATIDAGADHQINVTLQGKDEAYYMLKGKLSLVSSEGKLEAKEGEAVLFRSGMRHRVRNIGTEPAILLYVICPSVTPKSIPDTLDK